MKKYIPLSRIRVAITEPCPAQGRAGAPCAPGADPAALNILKHAEDAWQSLDSLRRRRERNINYVFRDQWSDLIRDEHGRLVPERVRVARRTGGVALQNNHLIKIIHAIAGLYAKQDAKPLCFSRTPDADEAADLLTNALQANWDNEQMNDLLTSEIEELLYGGLSVVMEEWSRLTEDEEPDAHTVVIEPSHFFFESAGIDPRHRDVSLIGHFEDYTTTQLAARFASTSDDIARLNAIYQPLQRLYGAMHTDQLAQLDDVSFRQPAQPDLCRVYHIWTHEHQLFLRCRDPYDLAQPLYHVPLSQRALVDEINATRLAEAAAQGLPPDEVGLIETTEETYAYWHYQALSPDGHILASYDCPYEHQSHPYTYKAFEYIAGDIIPFISSVIDQQRYINRLVTLFDLLIQASAKGVTMIPKSIVPKNMSESEFARSIRELGSFIFYDDRNGKSQAKPEIVTSSANMTGIVEMLNVQLGFIPEITSVSDAMRGKSPGANVAASRYAMESQNSTTSVASLLLKFSSFERDVAMKKAQLIHQFYATGRDISVYKANGYTEHAQYDRLRCQDLKFKVRIDMSPNTEVFRMAINDAVSEMWQTGAIDALQRLKLGYYPGAGPVIKALEETQQLMQQQAAQQQQQQQEQEQEPQPEPQPELQPEPQLEQQPQ